MRPHQVLAAAACVLALCFAASCQARATVIVDRGKGAANPAVETGGHRVRPGQSRPGQPPPMIDVILMETSWLAPFGLPPWGLFSSVSLPRHHVPAKAHVAPPRDGHSDGPASSTR